jgi:hypothetical protein
MPLDFLLKTFFLSFIILSFTHLRSFIYFSITSIIYEVPYDYFLYILGERSCITRVCSIFPLRLQFLPFMSTTVPSSRQMYSQYPRKIFSPIPKKSLFLYLEIMQTFFSFIKLFFLPGLSFLFILR